MIRLIPYWKSAWRFVSIQIGIIASIGTAWLIASPDAILHAWLFLPGDLKSVIPPRFIPMIGVGLFVVSMLARIVHQPKTQEKIEQKMIKKQLEQAGVDTPVTE